MKRHVKTRRAWTGFMQDAVGKVFMGRWKVLQVSVSRCQQGCRTEVMLKRGDPFMRVRDGGTLTKYRVYARLSCWRSIQLIWLLLWSHPAYEEQR